MKQKSLPIYLDNQATTPTDPRVLEEMMPYLTSRFGNAASKQHAFGWEAEAAVEQARGRIADTIGVMPEELVFTSGATEANNLALKGVVQGHASPHIVTAATEHKSVLDVCRALEHLGADVTILSVDMSGKIDMDELRASIRKETVVVSIMFVNNEIGTIQDIKTIGTICRERSVLFHTDATQGIGKLHFQGRALPVDLVSFSAHKMYGPKGCGALYARSGVRLSEHMHGGGHERGRRSGTPNVPGIVGFGKAAEICRLEGQNEADVLRGLRLLLWNLLSQEIQDLAINGHATDFLPGNINLRFPYIAADMMIQEARDIAFSTGSACSSHLPESSHVLKAIGLTRDQARSSARFGFGRFTTKEEVETAAGVLVDVYQRLLKQSPAYEIALAERKTALQQQLSRP